MTRIMEDNCFHCGSEIHKNQEDYHEKREEKLHQTRFSKIEKYTEELRGLRNLLESQFLKRKGWTEEEIAIKFADKEKYLKDIDHIVKTGERLKLH